MYICISFRKEAFSTLLQVFVIDCSWLIVHCTEFDISVPHCGIVGFCHIWLLPKRSGPSQNTRRVFPAAVTWTQLL